MGLHVESSAVLGKLEFRSDILNPFSNLPRIGGE